MAAHDYAFLTHWRVPAPPEEVYEVIADGASLSRWWPSVYLEVRARIPPPPGPTFSHNLWRRPSV